jgi:precorrin-6Y C5,15-methyltransferase (decarboxylating)
MIIGSDRLLASLASASAEQVPLGTDLAALARRIEREIDTKKIVILASGDPLFYGVARFLVERLGKEHFEVVPHVSSMQLAFARIMESWDEAYLTNVVHHPPEVIIERIRTAERVGLFTSESYGPPAIARDLLREGIHYFRCYVCENLGTRNEVITQGSLVEIAEMEFGPLNVMILIRLPDVPDRTREDFARKIFGNPDEAFKQSRPKRGLITPVEVRSLALAQLGLTRGSVVWDIGAGSGSVSIEAAQLAAAGRVYAIEPDVEDCQLIHDNARLFGATNIEVVCGRAPDAFMDLPDPDSIFVGGVGRETVGIVEESFGRLKPGGSFVVNTASLENTVRIADILRKDGSHLGLLMVNLSRGNEQLGSLRFEAVNPSFLIYVTKTHT